MAAPALAYEVRYRVADSNAPWTVRRYSADSTTITLTGLTRGKDYEGEARSIGPGGVASLWVPVTFVVAGPSTTPLPPINLTALSVADGVALGWSVADDQRPDVDYVVQRAPDAGGGPGAWADIGRVRALRFTDPLVDNVRHWYRVRAVSFAGVSSAYSNIVDENGRSSTKLIRSETPPSNPRQGDQWYQPSTKLTRYWNGTGWSLMSALVSGSAGRQLAPNHSFSSLQPPPEGYLVEGWQVTRNDGAWTVLTSGGNLTFRVNSGLVIGNGSANDNILVLESDKFSVTKGNFIRYAMSLDIQFASGLPSNVRTFTRQRISYYNANGTEIASDFHEVDRTSGTIISDDQVPALAVSARIKLYGYVTNRSGSTQTLGTLPYDSKVEYASAVVVNELEVAGSGFRIGDQRNLPQSNTTAYGSVRTATALSATSFGAVSVNAHIVRYGGVSVSYAAVSNAVTGLTVGNSYVIYCLDPAYEGGSRTWYAGTNPSAVMALGDGVVVAGQITIPSSGSSGGGGGGGGFNPDEWCVDADMVMACGTRAGDVEAGQLIAVWNDDPDAPAVEWLAVESNVLGPQPCHTLFSASGATVTASDSTPMTLRDGRIVRMPDMAGEHVLVKRGDDLHWEAVADLYPVAPRPVAKIKVHQRCYFAGADSAATIATHNPIKP